MSGIEDLSLEAPPILNQEQEERARRQARELISEALISAGTPLDNRGVKSHLLPGLWYATMSVLTTVLTVEECLQFLASRHQTIISHGDNADCPPRSLDPKAMQRYIKKVSVAAETIMEKLMVALERMEELEIDDRFAETVFDVALKVITPAWGPDHVRRAIMEQSSQLVKGISDGKVEIRNFMEPERFVSPAEKPRRQVFGNPEPVVEQAVTQYHVKRLPSDRTITCFAATERLEDGRSSWAIVMRIASSSGRLERRDIYGSIEDRTGNRVMLKLVHELALAICLDDGTATVDLRLTDPAIQRLLPDQTDNPVDQQRYDEQAWKDVAGCFAKHAITSKIVNTSMTDDQQERADKLLKNPDR
jgi:hypothetical protein